MTKYREILRLKSLGFWTKAEQSTDQPSGNL